MAANSLESFVNELNLGYDYKFSNGNFVINLENSDQFSEIFTAVSLNKDLSPVDKQTVTEDETSFTYTDGYYEIKLLADYDNDIYKAIISER